MTEYEPFEDWLKQHCHEVEAQEHATQERINRQKVESDLKFAMVNASMQIRLNELLVDKSAEYRRGFIDGRIFEMEWDHEISDL